MKKIEKLEEGFAKFENKKLANEDYIMGGGATIKKKETTSLSQGQTDTKTFYDNGGVLTTGPLVITDITG